MPVQQSPYLTPNGSADCVDSRQHVSWSNILTVGHKISWTGYCYCRMDSVIRYILLFFLLSTFHLTISTYLVATTSSILSPILSLLIYMLLLQKNKFTLPLNSSATLSKKIFIVFVRVYIGPADVPATVADGFCRVHNWKIWSHSAVCWIDPELIQNETFCISLNDKFSFCSAMLQKDTLCIRLNLGKIIHSVQILIVRKSTQKIIICQMQNWGRIYKSC